MKGGPGKTYHSDSSPRCEGVGGEEERERGGRWRKGRGEGGGGKGKGKGGGGAKGSEEGVRGQV